MPFIMTASKRVCNPCHLGEESHKKSHHERSKSSRNESPKSFQNERQKLSRNYSKIKLKFSHFATSIIAAVFNLKIN